MKPTVNVIIFDFDGVIVNSGIDIANAVNYTLRTFERSELPIDEIIGYVGGGAKALIRKSFEGCDEDTITRALPIYMSYYLENSIINTQLYPNVKNVLHHLRNKKLALVSNKPEALTRKIIEGLGIKEYFGIVLGPESLKHMKPHPEGLLKVLEAYGEIPEKALMIGDSYTDVEAGKAAGTLTCGVTYGLGDREALLKSNPDFVINDMGRLPELIA